MQGWNCSKVWWLNHGLGCFFMELFDILVLVPTSLNAVRYVELMGDYHLPFMIFWYLQGNGVFYQDNCTTTVQITAQCIGWFDEHSSDFSVINWLPKSPDINSVEHL